MPSTNRAKSLRLALQMADEARKIGARMKELREAKGLTQAQAAGLLSGDVQGAQWSRWETGRHRPTSERLEEIASVLGVEVWDLIAGPVAERAEKGETPDLIGVLSEAPPDRLEAIEQRLARIELILDAIREAAGLPAPDQDELWEAAARLRADLTPAQRQ